MLLIPIYALYSYVTHKYSASCLVEIKLFQNCFKLFQLFLYSGKQALRLCWRLHSGGCCAILWREGSCFRVNESWHRHSWYSHRQMNRDVVIRIRSRVLLVGLLSIAEPFLVTLCLMVWHWRVSRAEPMLSCWHDLLFLFCLLLFYIFLPSMGWLFGVGVTSCIKDTTFQFFPI